MAIIDKILNRDPREQLQRRLNELPSLSQSELQHIVVSDEDKAIRNEAVLLLDFGKTLLQTAFNNDDVGMARSACQRLADLLDNEEIEVQAARESLSQDQSLAVASLVGNDDKVEQLLNTINDQQELLALAKGHASARIRQWAAEKINDEAAQQELLKSSKGKDKNVYKLMKSRLDAQQEQARLQQERKNKMAELVEAIEKHSQSAVDPLWAAKLEHLKQQWQSLQSDADSAQLAQVATYLNQCEQLLAESKRQAQTEPQVETRKTEKQAANVDLDYLNEQRGELLEGLKKVIRVLLEDPAGLDKSHTELNCKNIDSRWRSLEQQAPVEREQKTLFQNLLNWVDYELNDIDTHGSLQAHYDKLINSPLDTDSHSLALQEKSIKRLKRRLQTARQLEFAVMDIEKLEQEFQQWLRQRQERIEQQQTLLRQIGGLIRKSQGALKSGKTGAAQGIRSTLREKCERVEKLPRHLEKQLQDLDAQLNKVQDWKEYAVLPKKRELVAQMQALAGADEPPEALATKIKRLQDEWKLLSRGGFNDDGELWEQFRQAGDQAFEPCAQFFAEQGKIRQDNLEKRQQLVQQLRDYNSKQNWDSPDWKQVAKLVQVAFNEWHAYQPVERAANKAVQKEFDEVIGEIRDKLNQEHQRNKEEKKALVEQAAKLVEMEDNRAAIEEAKQLQNRWKLLGSASHKADQALWKQFRKQCDQVFEKRKQINAEFKAGLSDNKNKVLALCEELHNLCQQNLESLLASRERVEEIRNEFREIGSLPKEKADDLQKRFRNAVDNFEKRIRQQQAKVKAGAWDSLLETYAAARNCCLAVAQGGGTGEEKAALDALMQGAENWPKGGADALQPVLQAISSQQTNNADDTDARRLLCIRGEILADLESPQEDHGLRMDYQVKQLTKGFGQAQRQFNNAKEAMQSLLLEWVTTLPTSDEDYEKLLARMNRCREKIGV